MNKISKSKSNLFGYWPYLFKTIPCMFKYAFLDFFLSVLFSAFFLVFANKPSGVEVLLMLLSLVFALIFGFRYAFIKFPGTLIVFKKYLLNEPIVANEIDNIIVGKIWKIILYHILTGIIVVVSVLPSFIPVIIPDLLKNLVISTTLINSNLKLVLNIIKNNIHKSNIPIFDLIQEGNTALIASIEKYNPDLGYKFGTYASWWVKQAIFKAISEQGNCVKIPVYIQETLSKYNKAKSELEKKYGEEVKKEDVCKKINLELNKIDAYLNAFSQSLSLNSAIDFTKENSMTLGDIIEDKKNNLENFIEQKSLKADINYVINLLNPREKDVIKKRYLIGEEFDDKKITLEEIGKEYGVTKECIRQIEKRVINKIKNNEKIKNLLSAYV